MLTQGEEYCGRGTGTCKSPVAEGRENSWCEELKGDQGGCSVYRKGKWVR